MKLKQVTLGVALALSGLAANAADTNWMTHDLLESQLVMFSPGFVTDTFSFTLDPGFTYTVTSNVQAIGVLAPFAFYGLFLADDTPVSSYAINSGSHTLTLAAGTYKYSVLASSPAGGVYSISSSINAVTPVPEPETYAMMLAGLAALGFLARRRQG